MLKENETIRLVRAKSKPNKDGHYFWNYYLVVGNIPVQIKLAFASNGLHKLMFAVAEECQISTTSQITPVK